MYTIKHAAERLGIAPATLRAWERRYDVVKPARTEGRYRLYDADDLAALEAMAGFVRAGMSPSQAAKQVRAGATPPEEPTAPGRAPRTAAAERAAQGQDRTAPPEDGLSRVQPRAGEPVPSTSTDPTTQADRAPGDDVADPTTLVTAARSLDAQLLEETLDSAFAARGFEHVVDHWLMPALRALGDAWVANTLDVAQEHFVSAGVMRRLAAAFDAAGQPRRGVHVLVGLVPGANHEIPTLAFATMLRRAGVRVTYLGPNVPLQSWVDAVRQLGPDAVVLGAPIPDDGEAAARVAGAIELAQPGTAVHVGGAGGTRTESALTGASLAEARDHLLEALPYAG